MASLQTIKEGYLSKRGKINTEWRQRWFVLNGKQLSYFKGGNHTPSGIIELNDMRSVSDLNSEGEFQVETRTRTYEIKAESREQGNLWIEAIRTAKSKL